jgi:uncharacterized membrane protein (UPF0127 family)
VNEEALHAIGVDMNPSRGGAVTSGIDMLGVRRHAPWWRDRLRRAFLPHLLLGLWALMVAWPVLAQPTFEESPLAIESGSDTLDFQVELARTAEQRQRGLMFRDSLDEDRGMLFDFGRTARVTMWMRNTYIPLDMLFIEDDGAIARIVANTEPLSDAVIGSGGPVRAVLELPAGTSADLGIEVGDRVIHPMFPAR